MGLFGKKKSALESEKEPRLEAESAPVTQRPSAAKAQPEAEPARDAAAPQSNPDSAPASGSAPTPESAPAPEPSPAPRHKAEAPRPAPATPPAPAPTPAPAPSHRDRSLETTFDLRLARYGEDLRRGLQVCYGDQADETFGRVLEIVARSMTERSQELRNLDEERLLSPDWLQDPRQLAYVAYADRFAGDLAGVESKVEYLDDLGVTHLHLMPLLEPRPGNSDGGYAVKNYRTVREDLGTMEDLESLASALHTKGMSLELDLVLNHVAMEHEWAERAKAGDQKYLDYFLTYEDRTEPDRWEQSLPEIFPDFAPGNFTWDDDLGRWVWTTFNAFQWDVNWANPDVFCEFVDIVCHLANRGVDMLRLDAIAFTWKRMGTNCQNLPEVHFLTRALRAAARIAAPALTIKAEAIVGPQDLVGYLGVGEHSGKLSDMAYHNSYMVQLWGALASRDTTLLRTTLAKFPPKPASATWGSYVRCHDDIGWAVTDEDAAEAGLSGHAHRAFLSEFYAGEFPDSFARGLVFQHNPATGDKRISGSLASLAGLERALESDDSEQIDLAIDRITLLHAAMLGFGGMPLLYMGDELGLLNDPHWAEDPSHADDNRWVHRPEMPWDMVDRPTPAATRVRARLAELIRARKALPQLHASVSSEVVAGPDARLLVLHRDHPLSTMTQVYNMSEDTVDVDPAFLRGRVGSHPREAITGAEWSLEVPSITVAPYAVLWFVGPERTAPGPA